ncbi:arsenical pump-driving ATPase [Phycisphaerales bacterium AB-hyl4]|uniref:arsenite-transporting ATPase n=1 Tax=Natronomicrosphaera hydrolytica TaxID=3242702 RepID=A0ABV4U6X7_9BACT
MQWIESSVRHLFFTGKGGVGKTSLACATAVKLADAGRRVLLVSTDPASNLSHVFEASIGDGEPAAIEAVPNLDALNIDPEAAAQAYRDRVIGPARDSLPAKLVRQMEEELSGACTTEIAAFDEFTGLLTDDSLAGRYDHIVFDTAPTGHTLRLMKLPTAWNTFLETNTSGASCLGPLAGLEKQKQRYADAVQALADAEQTRVILVARPEQSALAEADRTRHELSALGIANQRLIVNGVMPDPASADPLAMAMVQRGQAAINAMPAALAALPQDSVPLQGHNLVGVASLRALLGGGVGAEVTETPLSDAPTVNVPSLREMIDQLAEPGHGLVMVMGKGGVGKTTIAAAVAVELASRGHDVHLTTTDPAAHVTQTIEGELDRLEVSRIDPDAETERYRQHILETKGKDLDDQGRALLEEDLRSPCTEEIAVFQAFSRAIREASKKFVVVDTAPTGHTLLLLDATGSYHKEVMRHAAPNTKLVTPMMRLQDAEQTKMLLVTLPETTPVLEAAQLQDDLRRAGIEPWGWVINASLAAAGPTDPLLTRRARAEVAQIEKVQRELAARTAIVPWLPEAPVGEHRLRQLADGVAAETTNN